MTKLTSKCEKNLQKWNSYKRKKMTTDKELKKGNFSLDKDGNISYYVGWCALDYKDLEDLKYLLAERELKELEK